MITEEPVLMLDTQTEVFPDESELYGVDRAKLISGGVVVQRVGPVLDIPLLALAKNINDGLADVTVRP